MFDLFILTFSKIIFIVLDILRKKTSNEKSFSIVHHKNFILGIS